jgi:membrane protease YdiL (CAAX protease family)
MKPGKALSFLAVYNVVQNTLLSERGYVAGNAIATGVGLIWARASGLGWRELGMSRKDMAGGLRLGVGVATAASSLALLTRHHEKVRAMLNDDRLEDLSDREVWYRLLVRFPLGTALFEEVWFRGVLPAALGQHGSRHPELFSTVAFGAWHLIPTAIAINANPSGRSLSFSRRAGLVIGGSVAAGLAGLGFVAMRSVSSSLAAPWIAHGALNGLTFWIGLRSRRAGPRLDLLQTRVAADLLADGNRLPLRRQRQTWSCSIRVIASRRTTRRSER